MAPSDGPSKAVARLKTLKAKLKAKMTTRQAKSDTRIHGVPDAESEKNGKVSNNLELMQIQVSLSLLRPLNQTQLQGDWLRGILPTQRHRKLFPTLHSVKDSTFLIFTTSPLLVHSANDAATFERELEIWKKTLGPDGMTYVRLWNDGASYEVNRGHKSAFGAMREVLERNPAPISLLPSAWVGQLLSSCVRIACPGDCRYRRLLLGTLDWSPKENAIMLDLHLPLAFAESPHESTVHPHLLQLAIPKDTADECAELEVDPVFYVRFSKDAEKFATNAQKGLARFVLAHCARYAVTQNEATFLAQALIDRYGKKLYKTTLHSDIFSSSPARLLQEFRQRLPDHHGPHDQSLHTCGAIEKRVRFLVEESLVSQKNEKHAASRDTKTEREARDQHTDLRKHIWETQTELKSILSDSSELSKSSQDFSNGWKVAMDILSVTKVIVDSMIATIDRMETEMDNMVQSMKTGLDDLKRDEIARWELLGQQLMDTIDKP